MTIKTFSWEELANSVDGTKLIHWSWPKQIKRHHDIDPEVEKAGHGPRPFHCPSPHHRCLPIRKTEAMYMAGWSGAVDEGRAVRTLLQEKFLQAVKTALRMEVGGRLGSIA